MKEYKCRTDTEQQKIIDSLAKSNDSNEKLIADYVRKNQVADR